MKTLILIIVSTALSLYSLDALPHSTEAKEGKSVYSPIPKAIDLHEEAALQQADHNTTGHGGAQWSQKPSP